MILKYQSSMVSTFHGKKSSIMQGGGGGAADSTHTTSNNKSTSRRQLHTKRKKSGAATAAKGKGIIAFAKEDCEDSRESYAKQGLPGHLDPISLFEKRSIQLKPYPSSFLAFMPSSDSLDAKPPQFLKVSSITNQKSKGKLKNFE